MGTAMYGRVMNPGQWSPVAMFHSNPMAARMSSMSCTASMCRSSPTARASLIRPHIGSNAMPAFMLHGLRRGDDGLSLQGCLAIHGKFLSWDVTKDCFEVRLALRWQCGVGAISRI